MTENATFGSYELHINICASRQESWHVLTQQINGWWLPEFRILGTDSEVTFRADAGGQLVEKSPDGRTLLWFTTQMVVPRETIYLVGHCAADWGGPYISMLKLSLHDEQNGCRLDVHDSLMGNVKSGQLTSVKDGWCQLFTDGLKKMTEKLYSAED